MGRTFVAEENVKKTLDSIYTETGWVIGLIIGQNSSQKDFVLHVSPTPPKEGDAGVASLDSLSEKWVANHARQVHRMLPGGLDILGIFALARTNELKAAQTKLRQALFSVFKSSSSTLGSSTVNDKLVLSVCSLSRKTTCRTYDVTDHKCESKPAEWKYQSFAHNWGVLHSRLALEVVIPVPHPVMDHSALNRQIQAGLQTTFQSIQESLATINGMFRHDTELLDSLSDEKCYFIELYSNTLASKGSLQDSKCSDCGAKMVLRGSICGRAFVHQKSTVKAGVDAIKTDLARSLMSRCELLCEDLLQSEEEQVVQMLNTIGGGGSNLISAFLDMSNNSTKNRRCRVVDARVLYETPLRVFGKLPGLPLSFCDYMFPDESHQDLIDRCDELLGLHLSDDDLEYDCEKLPNEDDVLRPCVDEEPPSEPQVGGALGPRIIGATVTVGVGLLAVLYAYLGLD